MTLLDLFGTIARRWKTVGLTVLVCLLLTAAAAFLTRPVYRAAVVMLPAEPMEESQGGLGGGLGGLASLVASGPGIYWTKNITEAIAVLDSREFNERFIREHDLLPVLFSNRWDAKGGRWKKQPPTMNKAVQRLTRLHDLRHDRKNNTYALMLKWHDREQAAELANRLVAALNATMRDDAIRRAEAHIKYLNEELEKVQLVGTREAIFRLLEEQIRAAMMANVHKDYVFRVVEAAYVVDPDDHYWPKRGLMLFVGVLFGLALGSLLALGTGQVRGQLRS